MIFERAMEQDADEILDLYKSLVGTEYCTWTESYPGREEIDFDLSRGALFCLREKGQIIGVISIDQDASVEALSCWSEELQPAAELSRLGVHPDYQNRGIAGELILKLMEVCREDGKKSVHFLVAKSNLKARRAYSRLQCSVVGECSLFGEEWWCYEKKL